MKRNRMKKGYIVAVALLGALSVASAMPVPAHAAAAKNKAAVTKTKKAVTKKKAVQSGGSQSEINALKQALSEQSRQLAEQRTMIDKLMADRNNQQVTLEQIDARPSRGKLPQDTVVPYTAVVTQPVKPETVWGTSFGPGRTSPVRNATIDPPKTPTLAQTLTRLLPDGVVLSPYLDVSMNLRDSGYGSQFQLGSGGLGGTGLLITVDKQIMPGYFMMAYLDESVDLMTGTVGNPNPPAGSINNLQGQNNTGLGGPQFFSKATWLGARTPFGQIQFGRNYSGSYVISFYDANAMGDTLMGNGYPLIGNNTGMPTLVNYSVVYRYYATPEMPLFAEGPLKGFAFYATYINGNQNNVDRATDNSTTGTTPAGTYLLDEDAGRGFDVALYYRNGNIKNLGAAIGTWALKTSGYYKNGGTINPVPTDPSYAVTYQKETGLAMRTGVEAAIFYDFGFSVLYGTYAKGRVSGGNYQDVPGRLSSDTEAWSVSGKFPIGRRHAILASYTDFNDKSRLDRDARLIGIAYNYQLFNSTWLYANWGKMFNDNKFSGYTLSSGNSVTPALARPGIDQNGFAIGMYTRF